MVINQPAAIGDILFIEPICKHFHNLKGQKPILPVRDHLLWTKNYIESAEIVPLSTFAMDIDSDTTDNPDYLPLRFANPIYRKLNKWDYSDFENCMPDKYLLSGLDPEKWLSLNIKFDFNKGMKLMQQLDVKQSDDFILINKNSQAGRVNIKIHNSKIKIIEMSEVPGYNVVDWALLMLKAKENHHVSTSTFYIMQAITNQFEFKSQVFLYPRPNEDGLRGIAKLNPTFKFIKCE